MVLVAVVTCAVVDAVVDDDDVVGAPVDGRRQRDGQRADEQRAGALGVTAARRVAVERVVWQYDVQRVSGLVDAAVGRRWCTGTVPARRQHAQYQLGDAQVTWRPASRTHVHAVTATSRAVLRGAGAGGAGGGGGGGEAVRQFTL